MTKNHLIHAAAIAYLALSLGACHSGADAGTNAASPAPATPVAAAPIEHVDHISITHLDEQAVEKYPWGQIQWLMSGKIDPGAQQTFGVVHINAGQKNAMHLHPNCEEMLYVLSGKGEMTVADKKVSFKPGDLVRIPPQIFHQAEIVGTEPLVGVISYSSSDRQVVNRGTARE